MQKLVLWIFQNNDFRRIIKYFFLDKQAGLDVQSYGVPSANRSVVIYRPGLTDSTVAHEVFHVMEPYHPFNGKLDFHFDRAKTDNIMDYSDIEAAPPIPVISSWQWQWDILYENLNK